MPPAVYQASYSEQEPGIGSVEETSGLTVIEFGAPWCPICNAAQAHIEPCLNAKTDLRHLKIFDGKGKPLGRHYRVKLWPTLVLLKDGKELNRVVRPDSPEDLNRLFHY